MRSLRVRRYFRALCLCAIVVLFLLPALCFAEGEVKPGQEKASGSGASESDQPAKPTPSASPEKAAPTGEAAEPKEDKPKMVALNLNKVNIDQVVKFLSEITGKIVVKHKAASATITIVSPKKVTQEEAFALITEALRLEKVAIVEKNSVLWLLPINLLPDVDIELVAPAAEGPEGGIIRKVIPIRIADVKELANLIKPLLSKDATLVADPASRKIIVTDTVARVKNLESLIAQLDETIWADDRQVKIFPLKHTEAQELAPILKAALTTPGPARKGKAGLEQVEVRAYRLANWLVVVAPKETLAVAEQLIAKMDKERLKEVKVWPITLKYADPKELAAQLTRLFARRPGMPARERVEIVADERSNTLLVLGSESDYQLIKEVVQKLDKEQPKEVELRSITLKYAEARNLAMQLSRLFVRRPGMPARETVQIVADERSNTLLVLSSEANYQLIKGVVEELDREESVQMTTKTYDLTHADAEDIAEQMNDLYSGMQDSSYGYYGMYSIYYGGRPSGRQTQTRFVAEPRTNSVIAIAPPNEFERIDELIEKLDQPIDVEQVTPRIYPIRYIDASELTEMLNEVFGVEDVTDTGGYYYYRYTQPSRSQVGRLYGKVRFVADTATNSIIVTTNNKENFPIIEEFIKELDRVSPELANTMVRVLKHAKAVEVAEQLNRLFAREGARAPEKKEAEPDAQATYYSWLYGSPGAKKEERPISNLIGQVRVVPNARINAVLVTTAPHYFDILDRLIEELDISSPKVFVSVSLIEISRARASRIGMRYSSEPTVFESDDFDNGFRSAFGFSWTEVHRDGTLSADVNINVLVQFLQRRFDSRILSQPKLAMDNNVPASLFVGSLIPFITKSQISPEGSRSDSFEYKQAGIIMEITPNINQDGKVVLTVKLESSQRRPGEVILGGEILDTRKFETEMAVDHGQTMVIGGIMREEESEYIRRIPILGHLPLLKYLFSKKDTRYETTELIAFITPRVLRSLEDDIEVTRDVSEQLNVPEGWDPRLDILNEEQETEGEGEE